MAVLDPGKNLIGYAIKKSGIDFSATARDCLGISLNMAGAERDDIANTVSTGYGRKNVPFAGDTKTEIGCHASGCYLYFPQEITVIDIGGRTTRSLSWIKRADALALK